MYLRFLKPLLDRVLAMIALVLLSPVFVVVALLIKLKLGGKVLFSQNRPGLHGKIFKMYKFRSMTEQTDSQGNLLPDELRLTAFGKALRATSLDEIPSLFNIIKGDMSLVGPRPLLVQYLPLYNKEQARRHDVKPGLTGWAQVNGRNLVQWQERFALDVYYVDHVNLWLDMKILFLTVYKVFAKEGINEENNATMSDFTGNE